VPLDDRYTVISADCHAGGDMRRLPPVPRLALPGRVRRLGRGLREPVCRSGRARRGAELGQRTAQLRPGWPGDRGGGHFSQYGAAVLPQGQPVRPAPRDAVELEYRWAGLRAHNRWLADFCSLAPERRAGVGQILLGDLDQAIEGVHDRRQAGSARRGVLLPGVAPGSGVPPLYAEHWEPLWAAFAEEPGWCSTTTAGNAGPSPEPEWGTRLRRVGVRDPLVGAPGPVAADLQRHARTSPGPGAGADRAGIRVAAGRPGLARRDRRRATPARARPFPDSPDPTQALCPAGPASTGPASATWAPASCGRSSATSATASASTASCGAPTTPTTRGRRRTPRGAAPHF
jgi:hypothetical protein